MMLRNTQAMTNMTISTALHILSGITIGRAVAVAAV
jgi:hypothetical protein